MHSLEAAPTVSATEAEQVLNPPPREHHSQPPTVCLTGAPNAGKTALMNALTGGASTPQTIPVSQSHSREERANRNLDRKSCW